MPASQSWLKDDDEFSSSWSIVLAIHLLLSIPFWFSAMDLYWETFVNYSTTFKQGTYKHIVTSLLQLVQDFGEFLLLLELSHTSSSQIVH